MNHIMWKR